MKLTMVFSVASSAAFRSLAWTVSRTYTERVRFSPLVGSFRLQEPRVRTTSRFFATAQQQATSFQPGDKIQIEVSDFGPLGASVDVIGIGHEQADLIPEDSPPLGSGLILQKEIHLFRQRRNNLDVVRGEVLAAYVEKVREETGRLVIGLRIYGGKAKAEELSQQILGALELERDGTLSVGDKSSPEAIGQVFPGASKGAFKKAVAKLYKQGKVQPGPYSISLL